MVCSTWNSNLERKMYSPQTFVNNIIKKYNICVGWSDHTNYLYTNFMSNYNIFSILWLKFRYSEKATQIWKNMHILIDVTMQVQKELRDFWKKLWTSQKSWTLLSWPLSSRIVQLIFTYFMGTIVIVEFIRTRYFVEKKVYLYRTHYKGAQKEN